MSESRAARIKIVARAMALQWSRIGGDVYDQDPNDFRTDLSNLKVDGNVNFIALARTAIDAWEAGQ